MDTYAGGGAVLFIAICEIIGLMWFYGMFPTRPLFFSSSLWQQLAKINPTHERQMFMSDASLFRSVSALFNDVSPATNLFEYRSTFVFLNHFWKLRVGQ